MSEPTFLTKAADTKYVKDNAALFSSDDPNTPMKRAFLAHTLMRKDHDEHRTERMAMMPALMPKTIESVWAPLYAKLAATYLDRLPRGATSISGIAENIADAIERGWVYDTLLYGDSVVRSGYMLVGMLKTKNLRNGTYTLNKARTEVNEPPVDGGDDIIVPLNVVTAGGPQANPQDATNQYNAEVLPDGVLRLWPRQEGTLT